MLAACGGRDASRGPELQITTESTKVRRGDALPATSPIFDGETVRLRAAIGETLGVAVWLRERDGTPVWLELGSGVGVEGFAVTYQRVRRPSTRMYGPSLGAGEWPDRLIPVRDEPVHADGGAFFEVAVPADAAPGLRRGVLRVRAREIPVELTIEDVVLPPIDREPRVWGYFDPREVVWASGITPGSEAARTTPVAWARWLRGYGVIAAPDLAVDDWDAWRDQVRGLPWVPVRLPDDLDAWPSEIRTWTERLDDQEPFAIPVDEPRALWQKLVVRERAAVVREAGGGEFLYAVTDAPHFVYGDLVDLYISPFAPAGSWTYNGTPPYAGSMILDTHATALRTWGWIGWRWRVPLWYVWDLAYWTDRYHGGRRTDADDDAVSFDDGEDRGNLDGVLAWYGDRYFDPTLRLEALRRGLQDRLLLELLERCAGREVADAIAAELVPVALVDAGPPGQSRAGAWPTDEAAWEAARGRLLDELTRRGPCR